MAKGIRHHLELPDELIAGHVVFTGIGQHFECQLHRLQQIAPAQHQSRQQGPVAARSPVGEHCGGDDGRLEEIFSPLPAMGFLAQADKLEAGPHTAASTTLIFNNRLDAAICAILLAMVAVILLDSLRVWAGILRGTRDAQVCEAPFVLSQLRAEEL